MRGLLKTSLLPPVCMAYRTRRPPTKRPWRKPPHHAWTFQTHLATACVHDPRHPCPPTKLAANHQRCKPPACQQNARGAIHDTGRLLCIFGPGGEHLHTLDVSSRGDLLQHITWVDDNSVLGCCGTEATIWRVDQEQYKEVGTFATNPEAAITQLAMAPDGRYLAAACDNGTVSGRLRGAGLASSAGCGPRGNFAAGPVLSQQLAAGGALCTVLAAGAAGGARCSVHIGRRRLPCRRRGFGAGPDSR